MTGIVGVKYIGSKQRKEDNVLNTGVTWAPGQVINFDSASASRFAEHATVWEITDVDHEAETKVVSAPKKVAGDPRKFEPQTFANVNAMDKEQLHAFARTSLLRQLPDMELEPLREEVKNLLTLSFLDDQQDIANANKAPHGLTISLVVTQEEFEAYSAGELVLKLVAAGYEVNQANINQDDDLPTREELEAKLYALPGDYDDPEFVIEALKNGFGELFTLADEEKVRELVKPKQALNGGNQDPHAQLKADLALLDAKQLREMCKKVEIPYANTMSADVLREKIIAAASEKAE